MLAFDCSFQQIGILLLAVHYVGDAMLHGARLIHFIGKKEQMTRSRYPTVGCNVYLLYLCYFYLGFILLQWRSLLPIQCTLLYALQHWQL